MSHATLLLYETGRRWSGLLRRTLQPAGVRVEQEGSLAACARRLLAGEACLAAIETQPAQLTSVLELAVRANRYAAPAGVVVLADRELAPLYSAMQEAGVIHSEFSPRGYRRLGEIIRLWLQEYAPKQETGSAESPPWPEPLAEVLAGWHAGA